MSQSGSFTRPTLRDVAALAGVSIKTASRALAGESGVAPQTQTAVEAAAQKLHYAPNRLAQQLRAGVTSKAIALLVGELANPFYSELASGVEETFRPAGFDLFIASTDEEAKVEEHLVANFIERSVDGVLILAASNDHFYIQQHISRGTPFVFLDRPPQHAVADAVVLDNRAGARMAAEVLDSNGHERIAVFADAPTIWTSQERVAGFKDYAVGANIRVRDSDVRYGLGDQHRAKAAFLALLELPAKDRPTAVLALNNQIALGVLAGIAESGEPLSLVAFDDFELAELLGVTVVAQDPRQLGRVGADLLIARIDNPDAPPSQVALQPELRVRASSALGGTQMLASLGSPETARRL